MRFKIALSAAVAVTCMIGAAGSAYANVTPITSGTCIGNCGNDTADGSVTLSPLGTPTYQFISTNGGVTGAGEIAGVGGTNGSSLQTATFTAAAGSVLNLYFNYITSDGGGTYSDYAFSQLLNADNSVNATLFTARTEPSGNTSPGMGLPANQSTLNPTTSAIIAGAPTFSPLGSFSGQCFGGTGSGCGYTGWIDARYTIQSAGIYSVLFGVTNIGDTSYDTALAFDGVTVGGMTVGATAVPEPAPMLLLGPAALGLIGLRRRQTGAAVPA